LNVSLSQILQLTDQEEARGKAQEHDQNGEKGHTRLFASPSFFAPGSASKGHCRSAGRCETLRLDQAPDQLYALFLSEQIKGALIRYALHSALTVPLSPSNTNDAFFIICGLALLVDHPPSGRK
jgi:hypothetical protein